VNKFDDNAKDSLDEWIYFLKNSEIKKEFSAKGIKEANKVLQVANMSKEDRADYQRFVEVLSDRASIVETIEFESELKSSEKIKNEKKYVVMNLLIIGILTDEQIAASVKISIEFVKSLKEE